MTTVEKRGRVRQTFFLRNPKRLVPLFLLDRLEFCVVDLFSGNEQVEPRMEFFQMRILRYCGVDIFHVGGVFETGYLNPKIFVLGHTNGGWRTHLAELSRPLSWLGQVFRDWSR